MDAFAGVVKLDEGFGSKDGSDVLRRALGVAGDKVHSRHLRGATFAQCVLPIAGRSRAGSGPFIDRHGLGLFAAQARLDNRAEIAVTLGLAAAQAAAMADAQLLLAMVESRGEPGIAQCLGAFAFALWNAEGRTLTLGRDCLGNKALFYHRGRGFVAFASTLRSLLALPDVPRELDEIALANFMALDLTEGQRTFIAA